MNDSTAALNLIIELVDLARTQRLKALGQDDRKRLEHLEEQARDFIDGARPAPRRISNPKAAGKRPAPAVPPAQIAVTSSPKKKAVGLAALTSALDIDIKPEDRKKLSSITLEQLPESGYTPSTPSYMGAYYGDLDPDGVDTSLIPTGAVDPDGKPIDLKPELRNLLGLNEAAKAPSSPVNATNPQPPPPEPESDETTIPPETEATLPPEISLEPEKPVSRSTPPPPAPPPVNSGPKSSQHLVDDLLEDPMPTVRAPSQRRRPRSRPPSRRRTDSGVSVSAAPTQDGRQRAKSSIRRRKSVAAPKKADNGPKTDPTGQPEATPTPKKKAPKRGIPAIVHMLEGGTKKGRIENFDATLAQIELLPSRASDEASMLEMSEVLAIFFGVSRNAQPMTPQGDRMLVKLINERQVSGTSMDYQEGGAALTIVPEPRRGNIDYVWIPAWSVKAIELL